VKVTRTFTLSELHPVSFYLKKQSVSFPLRNLASKADGLFPAVLGQAILGRVLLTDQSTEAFFAAWAHPR
jgi:hypothetical protein